MARDGSGNYTLPAGNPVVTGTTIDASWANPTLDDLATEITDSLSRSGKGGMLVGFPFADGTMALPGLTFASETNSGWYRAATNDMRATIAGVDRARFRADASNPFQIWNGASWGNVVVASVAQVITAAWQFESTAGIVIDNVAPLLEFLEDDAAADNQKWVIQATATEFNMNLSSDADVYVDFFKVTRTANVADALTLTATAINLTGAVVATSYDGIVAADLVDKSAVETITGAWALPATASIDGITATDLTDKSAAENIAGSWLFDFDVTTSGEGTGGLVKDGTDVQQPMGFNVMPLYDVDVADVFDLAHNGMYWHNDGAATFGFTCDQDATIPTGATYVCSNDASAGVQTIVQGSGVTLKWFDGSGTVQTGTRTLAVAGICTVYKYSLTEFHIWGTGLS